MLPFAKLISLPLNVNLGKSFSSLMLEYADQELNVYPSFVALGIVTNSSSIV